MAEILNEEDLNIVLKLVGNKNYRFANKSPVIMPTLSKVIKRKTNNNSLYKSQKIQKDQEQLTIGQHRNSINNIYNLRANLPNIMTSLTPIERRNYKRTSFLQKNRNTQGAKTPYVSRNYDSSMFNYDMDSINFFENEQLNNTFQLKQMNKLKNKYYENDSDKNLAQIQYKKNKNNISIGSNNLYSRNIDNKNNYLQNNMNSVVKNSGYNKMKFTLNKKNLMNTIKKH